MSKFYDNYWTKRKLQTNDFSFKWPAIKKLIPTEPGLKILDFGCGSGKILAEAAKLNPTSKYYGIDVSRVQVLKNKKKFPNMSFSFVEDGEKFPYRSDVFDFIISTDTIEHVYHTDETIKELHRVLKPDGQILITTPYHGVIKNVILAIKGFDIVFDPRGAHIRFYTKNSLLNLLNKFGFVPIKFGYYGRFYPVSRAMYCLFEKK